MAIVINDFEIVAPPSENGQTTNSAANQRAQAPPAAQAQTLTPEDIERITLRLQQRRLRLWAD